MKNPFKQWVESLVDAKVRERMMMAVTSLASTASSNAIVVAQDVARQRLDLFISSLSDDRIIELVRENVTATLPAMAMQRVEQMILELMHAELARELERLIDEAFDGRKFTAQLTVPRPETTTDVDEADRIRGKAIRIREDEARIHSTRPERD